jgi:CRISPR-associated endonuclease Cas2
MAKCQYLIGYDIADNKDRRQALRCLRANSFGYQDSVFELELSGHKHSKLLTSLTALLKKRGDKLFCLRLGGMSTSWQLGKGIMSPTGSLLIIN